MVLIKEKQKNEADAKDMYLTALCILLSEPWQQLLAGSRADGQSAKSSNINPTSKQRT